MGIQTVGDDARARAQRMRKRSIAVAGHRTSISLEDAFWSRLGEIAAAKGTSIASLVTEIDRSRAGNLSSAIRVYILEEATAHSGKDA